MGLIGELTRAAGEQVAKSLFNIRTVEPEAAKKELGWNLAGSFAAALRTFNSYSDRESQLRAYVDWVYGAVRAIAEDGASVDLRLYVNRGGTKNATVGHKLIFAKPDAKKLMHRKISIEYWTEKGQHVKAQAPMLEEIENHKLLDLLYKPNGSMTKTEFFELIFTHLELTGEFFAWKERNGIGVPIALWPLMPYKMKEKVNGREGRLEGWVYTNQGKRIPIDPEDIIHVKYTDPNNIWRGMGVVRAAAASIDTDAQAAEYNRRFFYNNGRIDAALVTEQELSDESFERMKQQWNDIYGGTVNAHKTAILEGGLDYKPIAITQKEMDFLESRKFNRDQILALFRVSASILGISENINRANAEAAEFTFAKRVIRPKLERLTSTITENLAGDFDPKLLVSFTDPVPEDKEFNLKSKEVGLNKWYTINEIRAENGDAPIPGGDELYIPISNVPLSVVSATPEPSDPNDEPVQNSLGGGKPQKKK